MLGDIDRQQSSRGWLRRRDPSLPGIAPWTIDQKNVLRVPTGITHVVLDTPGGLHGFELARIVMFADAIVLPVCPSVFDRESAAPCLAELHDAAARRQGPVPRRHGRHARGRPHHAAECCARGRRSRRCRWRACCAKRSSTCRAWSTGLTLFDLPPSRWRTTWRNGSRSSTGCSPC
jgi:chromosome partitioning protein